MNAIEFVKEFGWREAQICLLNCASPEDKWFMRRGNLISDQDFDDLKEIVDAFELVESYGGLETAKTCEYSEDLDHVRYNIKLAKAINLVEQCNG